MYSLVILGTNDDPHVERVAAYLSTIEGAEVVVLDYNNGTKFSVQIDAKGGRTFRVNDVVLSNYIVWDRRKLIPGTDFYIKGDEEHSGYAAQEWRSFYTLVCGFAAGNAFNSLASRACLIKPFQQSIASQVGMLTPPTLVTNDKADSLAFQASQGSLILKSVSGAKVQTASEGEYIPFNIMTMRVDPSDLLNADDHEIGYCPHFFQKEIVKDYELRVVYIDGEIWSFKIESQCYRTTEVDWRKAMDAVQFTRFDMNDDLSHKIARFMEAVGLTFGSLDLIVDRTGECWFLECNQDGAWGWLDDIVEGAIARSFANAFLRRMSSGSSVCKVDGLGLRA